MVCDLAIHGEVVVPTISPLRTRWVEARLLGRLLPFLPRFRPGAAWSPARLLEQRAARDGSRPGILFEDRAYTWSEVDAEVNRTARLFQAIGIREGDIVAILMDNRPEFLFALTALNRLRAAGALINTNIAGAALAHAVRIAKPTLLLVGHEHIQKAEKVLSEIPGLSNDRVRVQGEPGIPPHGSFAPVDDELKELSGEAIRDLPRGRNTDHFGYIYTSGTTGLPKAAVISNLRILMPGGLMGRGVLELTPDDVVYIATPLYHSVGIFVGWGATLATGAALALRRRFSASQFWDDADRFKVTAFVYIGELCRYLLNQPTHPKERGHSIRVAAGNGLRPDIWTSFQARFGIPLIREYYGATEGNGMTINAAGRPGMVGRLIGGARLIRCDLETGAPYRSASGRCEEVSEGETGLWIAPIRSMTPFDGYADRSATTQKVLEDVFRAGDRFFNSGDLLVLRDDRWLAFADRVGDTFRWKGENVSTNEVAEILNGAAGVLETNVYGVEVPGSEGRAGMASIHCDDTFSIEDFARYVIENLAGYQRPLFVRLQKEMQITVTFKHRKVDYRRDGYNPHEISDPLFVLENGGYVRLDDATYSRIVDGRQMFR
jgi:acyl-CoA synthetase (AMP-forming)/AMP-acid ligase II